MNENLASFQNPIAERKALSLLRGIVGENRGSLKLHEDRLTVTTRDGTRYSIELRSGKVYSESGKFVCVRVLTPNLPVIDQVIAKSLYLLSHPDPLLDSDYDLLFKLTFAGIEPRVEWPWIRSMSYSTLGEAFSGLIGADFAVKEIRTRDLSIKLQMWYVNYDNRFKSIRRKHITGSMGGIVLCTGNSELAKAMGFQTSIDELRSCNGGRLPIAFVGLYDEAEGHSGDSGALKLGKEIARRNSIPFFACSLDHPSTIRKPLIYVVEAILGRRPALTVTG